MYIYFHPVVFSIYLLLSFFFPISSQPSQIGCLPYFHRWCGLSGNLRCRSETCYTRLAEIQHAGNDKNSPSGHRRTNLSGISSQLRHVSTIGKNLLSSNISSTCSHNMVNFGSPLAAEIGSLVSATPPDLNGFRVLAALLHGTLVVGVSQTLQR